MGLPVERVGAYRLQELLGSGGMGQVFAAVHEHMDRQVAVKLLKPEVAAGDPQGVARFLQEARALARLQHPGIVQVLDCGRLDDGTVFLVMERLHGLSLLDWMRRRHQHTPLEVSLALARQVAESMAHVHTQGIVHRDLKPANVFLCPDESVAPGYRAKLLDFGVAKVPPAIHGALVDTQVQTNAPGLLGTYTHMAPEQCLGKADVDGRADVYALGVLLFELLADRPPFVADTPVEVISMHVHVEPPALKELTPTAPSALSAFIARMLAKSPEERPAMLQCRDMLGRAWQDERQECPVPGLAPFTESQAELFFGRRQEAQELLRLLEEARMGRRWVQLEGPSGVGKSSLVQAGLLPRLRASPDQGTPRWLVASMRPSYDPLHGLAQAVATAYAGTGLAQDVEQLEQSLRKDSEALRALVTAQTPPGCCLLLVLEQMEELFTLGAAESRQLDELVSKALAAPECPLRLLTTLRSDFLHRLEQVPGLARQLNGAARYLLRPMEEEALAQVIQGMARHAGLRLADGLAERMVGEARSEGSRLPLLGHALQGLWSLRSGALLMHEHYEQLGGVGGALARQAEQLLDSLGEEGRERAKWLLLELVQVGRDVPDTRRTRTRQQVLTAAGGDALAEQVLLRLSGMRTGPQDGSEQSLRLVVLSSAAEPSQQRVDLVHETLLRKVPRIKGWLEHERARLERYADLEVAAHAWEQAGRPKEGLPTGTLLRHYQGGMGPSRPHELPARRMSEEAKHFLQAAWRLERRRTWTGRGLVLASIVAVAAIAFSAVQADAERQRAEEHLQQIVNVVQKFVSGTDWKLGRLAHTLESRRNILEDFHQRLVALPEEERDRPTVRAAIIETRHRLADLSLNDDSLRLADKWLSEALEEINLGLELQPGDARLKELLALNSSKRGKVHLAREQYEQAGSCFDEATLLLGELPEKEDAEDRRRTRATSYLEQAEVKLALGHAHEAAHLLDEALALFEQNEGNYNQSLLAEALLWRARAALRAGDSQAAEGHLERALDIQSRVADSEPGDLFFRWIKAQILVELGALRGSQGRRDEAAGHYQEAVALGRHLRLGEADSKRYALVLAQALLGLELFQARHWRGERCVLISAFVRKDPQDMNFRRLLCE